MDENQKEKELHKKMEFEIKQLEKIKSMEIIQFKEELIRKITKGNEEDKKKDNLYFWELEKKLEKISQRVEKLEKAV